MITNQKISHFEGTIATGKEANVYHTKGSMDLKTKEMFEMDEDT
jgi:serine/threonine-protein kinase RIO1